MQPLVLGPSFKLWLQIKVDVPVHSLFSTPTISFFPSGIMLFLVLAVAWCLCQSSIAYNAASYRLLKDYQAGTDKFFQNFNFFTGLDPTNGFVKY